MQHVGQHTPVGKAAADPTLPGLLLESNPSTKHLPQAVMLHTPSEAASAPSTNAELHELQVDHQQSGSPEVQSALKTAMFSMRKSSTESPKAASSSQKLIPKQLPCKEAPLK
mmetsp:Transcript_53895/g.128836  ORF Transcript_53895/g.128836 Transcript_53895/m.128836 type:complete len:112 (+) Transcript_53895:348-683(+)